MQSPIGYMILAVYSLMLGTIVLLITRKYPVNGRTIDEFILAGRNVPFGLLAPSIFVSWIWVTTIVGSAEAGVIYGISGGWAYSLGAIIAFAILILVIVKIRRMMPEGITFIDFAGLRFSVLMKDTYFIFAILVVVYLSVEQAAGIALVFNGLFDVSFKKIAFITVMIAGVYVLTAGMRGVLYNELINFFIISLGFILFAGIIIHKFDLGTLFDGLKDVQSNPLNNNFNPEALSLLSKSGTMYAISAIIIALGQICLDPAYFIKAHIAKDEKTMVRSFVFGGIVFWTPVAIISSFVIGYVTLSKDIELKSVINRSIAISTGILQTDFGIGVQILFAILIFCIGITSIIHGLIGIQSIFTISYYKDKIKPDATEAEQIKFGRTVTFLIAVLCALIAISLEKVSLLTIDTFSGIFFAATCGGIFAGIWSKKVLGSKVLVSIILGILTGFIAWAGIEDPRINWLYGSVVSFAAPILFLSILSLLTKRQFNFTKLLHFRYYFNK
ncbi:MAG TPA: hypothetical protein VM577_00050 [Anaerovoracaceae bacterium]|nr:hypothetical protein [Anaerovoracaceae bacterium]